MAAKFPNECNIYIYIWKKINNTIRTLNWLTRIKKKTFEFLRSILYRHRHGQVQKKKKKTASKSRGMTRVHRRFWLERANFYLLCAFRGVPCETFSWWSVHRWCYIGGVSAGPGRRPEPARAEAVVGSASYGSATMWRCPLSNIRRPGRRSPDCSVIRVPSHCDKILLQTSYF